MKPLDLVLTVLVGVVVLPGVPRGAAANERPGGLKLPAVSGDQPAVVTVTLADAVDRGVKASHRLAELRAREAGARATVQGRDAADRPQFSVQAGYMRTNHITPFGLTVPGRTFEAIYPDVPDNYRTRLDLQWPIYTFGRTGALEAAAQAELQATGKDLEAAQNDLRLEITRAFWALVTANESVRVVAESLKRMDASLEDARNRLKVGLVPPNDVLSVEAQRSRQQMLLIQARNLRDQATADLARLVGLDGGALVEPQAALEEAGAPVPAVEPLLAEARKARPDRQALAVRASGAGERLAAAEAGRKPVLAVAGGFDYARPNPRIFPRAAEWHTSWDAGVSFTWLLWDGGRVAADIGEATATRQAANERLAEFDRQLEVEVRQRALDLESARAAIAAANDAVRAATEAQRVVGDRYAAGVATTTDVLDAQVALLQAGLDRTQALANARLAEARLDRAIGR
jgi:outer membrane protein TolC